MIPDTGTIPAGPDPAELDMLAALVHRDTDNRAVLASNRHVLAQDFGDPINRVIYAARIACASDGESGEALLLARLRADGHLARDVDGRIGARLAELLTRRVDVLQLPALAVAVLDRAECRLIASHADMGNQVWDLPPEERRDALRAYWSAYRDLTERMDAAGARIGHPATPKRLEVVA